MQIHGTKIHTIKSQVLILVNNLEINFFLKAYNKLKVRKSHIGLFKLTILLKKEQIDSDFFLLRVLLGQMPFFSILEECMISKKWSNHYHFMWRTGNFTAHIFTRNKINLIAKKIWINCVCSFDQVWFKLYLEVHVTLHCNS